MGTWLVAGVVGVAAGALLLAGSAVYVVAARRYAARALSTEGTVIDLVPYEDSTFPVVTFRALGPDGAPGPILSFEDGQTGSFEVGQEVTVHYDPHDPSRAALGSPGEHLRDAGLVALVGAFLGVLGAVAVGLIAPIEAGRDEAVDRFVAAVRSGDADALAAATTEGAVLDPAFVARLRAGAGFEVRSSALGFGTGCVNGTLGSGPDIPLALVEVEGRWLVRRAGGDWVCEVDAD